MPGADTTIEITKDKDDEGKPMGLGLSIVGGSDTLLGAIFIHEVYEKGAAHKDGRLRPGDQVLYCNLYMTDNCGTSLKRVQTTKSPLCARCTLI